MKNILFILPAILAACSPCYQTAPYPFEQEFTLGVAQREIAQGMPQSDVAAILGAPNIVTKDKDGRESWIYDKIASEASYKNTSAGICLVLFGANSQEAYAKKSQRTLTIVIKFNEGVVENVSYHASSY